MLREQSGQGETDAFAAAELPDRPRLRPACWRSRRSGTTTEVLDALAGDPGPTYGDHRCPDDSGRRRGRRLRGAGLRRRAVRRADGVRHNCTHAASRLARASAGTRRRGAAGGGRCCPRDGVSSRAQQYTFLGAGWAHGVAREAALKMREAAQLWTESYPQMEYRHGPIAIAEPGRAVWVFGEPVRGCSTTSAPPGRGRVRRPRPVGGPGASAAAGGARGGEPRPRPRPATSPDPLGRAGRLVILCAAPSPAWDVTLPRRPASAGTRPTEHADVCPRRRQGHQRGPAVVVAR